MTELSERQRNLLICLGLTVAIVAVYWPVGHFNFVNYDDSKYVTENPHVLSGLTLRNVVWSFRTEYFSNWHPMTWLSYMLDCQLFGLNAGAHHLVNVFFHILNTLLLFHVLNRMTRAPWRSGFVAALFALHPLHVESVAWIAERKDVLSAFFWMLTIWAYVRYVETFNIQRSPTPPTRPPQKPCFGGWKHRLRRLDTPRVFYATSLLFFVLGLMSKPMVVTLPFVLLLLDYWPLGRIPSSRTLTGNGRLPWSQLLKEKLPFLALTVLSCIVTFRAQSLGGALDPLDRVWIGDRMANAVVAYMSYLSKTFWPSGLAVFYPYHKWPLETIAMAGLVLAVVSSLVIWKRRQEPYFLMGWLWFLGTLVPVIGLVQVGAQAMADRYSYLPSIGLFIIAAWAVPRGLAEQGIGRLVTITTAAAALTASALVCRLQVRYWNNTETLFHHAIEVTTNNFIAHYNLGVTLWKTGRFQEAIGHYEQAVKILPSYAEAQNNLGVALTQMGRLQEAIPHWEQAVRIWPDSAELHNNLGLAFWQLGRIQEGIGHFEYALRIDPQAAGIHYNLGLALRQAGRTQEAIAQWEQALRISPPIAGAHYELGLASSQAGNLKDAIVHYEQALRIQPNYAEASYSLGLALWQTGKVQEAIKHYEQALRIKPDYAEAHCGLGTALFQSGRTQDAIRQYEQALRARPDYAEVQNNLAWLLVTLPPSQGGDPKRAMALAQKACEATSNREPGYLDTLAAAYAANGRFEDAAVSAQHAIELARAAGQTQLARDIEVRLELYRSGQAYRQLRNPVPTPSTDLTPQTTTR